MAAAAGVLTAAAVGKMMSTQLEPKLCETKRGGKFVKIPGFPGEKVDRRLLTDIEYLVERYKIFITDGYSTSDVHARNGEHPIGLALDIVPATRRWRRVTKLAKWAEPTQDRPRAPFRWVGYKGDAGHGRGDHLHLSWSHSDTRPEKPARTVYTINCPEQASLEEEVEDPAPEPSGGIGSKIRRIQRSAVPEKG
ncbi:MAG: hypothetical protein ACRDL3_04990 [Solirubrobacterales bacterium]